MIAVTEYRRHLIEANAETHTTPPTINRPTDAETMRAAIHELRNRGMRDHEIADATALSVQYVRTVLAERQQHQ
jgi:hypothetical protein